MKAIAKVINNNQPGWTNIVETAPNVTLDVGTELYMIDDIIAENRVMDSLLDACKFAYRKHHLDDESIGWNELSDILLDALCNAMGDGYHEWLDSVAGEQAA